MKDIPIAPRLPRAEEVTHALLIAHVFFATADWSTRRRRLPWRARLRIGRRFPRRVWGWLLSALVRFVTRSPIAHCAVGDHEIVIDPGVRGNRAWPLIGYALCFPTLVCSFEVPLPPGRRLDLDTVPLGEPKRVLPTLLRWWTGGRWQTDDCCCLVVRLLIEAGVDVPPRIYRPVDLHDWLAAQGYRRHDFTDDTPTR